MPLDQITSSLDQLANELRTAARLEARFKFEPQQVENIDVRDIEDANLGTSGLSGHLRVAGSLVFTFEGEEVSTSVITTLRIAQHPHSGHVDWQPTDSDASEFVAAALREDYRAGDLVLKRLRQDRVEFVPHENNKFV